MVSLPNKVDLSPWFPPPGDQHQQYSCAAWAMAYGVQTYCNNRRDKRMGHRTGLPDPDAAYSPAYLFSLFKQVGDTTPCDVGINLDRFVGFSRFAGLCSMSQAPYDTSLTGCDVQIPPTVMSMGMSLAVRGLVPLPTYLPQSDLNQWKAHLAAGEALMVLFVVDSVSFCSAGFKAAREHRPFVWDLATFNGVNSGGHAMACAGYDDSDSTLLVMNSFGQDWGDRGYVKIPYVNVRKKSFGAYAFPWEGPGRLPSIVGMPVADSIRTGLDTIHVPMKEGQYVVVNGVKLVFSGASPNGLFALVAVSDHASFTTPYILRMKMGENWGFFNDGKSITFSWTQPGGKGSAVVFRAVSAPAINDDALAAWRR